MCMLTLSAFRLTNRGIGSPLTEPEAIEPVTSALVSACAAAIPAQAAISITDRYRNFCRMLDAVRRRRPERPPDGRFVLKRPSDRESQPLPIPVGGQSVAQPG